MLTGKINTRNLLKISDDLTLLCNVAEQKKLREKEKDHSTCDCVQLTISIPLPLCTSTGVGE